MLLSALAERESGKGRTLLLVCASAADAQRFRDEIAWLAPSLRIALLADWETLAWDAFSPHDDLVSERLATLHAMQSGAIDLVIAAATTVLHRLAPPSYIASRTFQFRKGQKLDEARLRSQLTSAGYSHVLQVVHPGEYCVRGGLIDLFPMGASLPFRLDLFDDELEIGRAHV